MSMSMYMSMSSMYIFICNIIFSNGRSHLSDITDEKFRRYKADMVSKMVQYLTNTSCRRR